MFSEDAEDNELDDDGNGPRIELVDSEDSINDDTDISSSLYCKGEDVLGTCEMP